MQLRDARGRFAGSDGVGAGAPREPIILSEGQLAVLRDLPEVWKVVGPGEELDGHKCVEGHYLVKFWPLLTRTTRNIYGSAWELAPPITFNINTLSRADTPGDGSHIQGRGHFAYPVVAIVSDRNGSVHPYIYTGYGGDVPNGALCRGTASFSNNPFSCILMLRLWLVQTVDGYGSTSGGSAQWWEKNGAAFLAEPNPQCILVPGIEPKARVVGVKKEWVEAMKKAATRREELVVEQEDEYVVTGA